MDTIKVRKHQYGVETTVTYLPLKTVHPNKWVEPLTPRANSAPFDYGLNPLVRSDSIDDLLEEAKLNAIRNTETTQYSANWESNLLSPDRLNYLREVDSLLRKPRK